MYLYHPEYHPPASSIYACRARLCDLECAARAVSVSLLSDSVSLTDGLLYSESLFPFAFRVNSCFDLLFYTGSRVFPCADQYSFG
jgi:hypothetical protein